MHRDQRGFEVTVVDSVKGNDGYIYQINDILLFSRVYFKINLISDTLFAQRKFSRGDFLMEYRGILCKQDPGRGAYILKFETKGSKYY